MPRVQVERPAEERPGPARHSLLGFAWADSDGRTMLPPQPHESRCGVASIFDPISSLIGSATCPRVTSGTGGIKKVRKVLLLY
jgi:hypothetical protein